MANRITASSIRSAQAKAVGGGKKRCRKGKSCSATCIAANKYCLVEFTAPPVLQALPRVVAMLQGRKTGVIAKPAGNTSQVSASNRPTASATAAAPKPVTPKIGTGGDAKSVEESPKYDKTPGSTKAIAKPEKIDVRPLEKEKDMLTAQMEKTDDKGERWRLANEVIQLNSRIRAAQDDTPPPSPGLTDIYQQQGFNRKPELVGTAGELRGRKDLLTNPDGTNVIMYRGVTTQEFSDQFKGLGGNGGQHFTGKGIYGNGSYASAAASHATKATEDVAQSTARAYTGARENSASKVTSFGLRKDANVVTFSGADYFERSKQYDRWSDRVIDRANKKTGYRFKDVGEAAAALGIHAYQVPQQREDFFVVLNRGAVVAAMDSQLSE